MRGNLPAQDWQIDFTHMPTHKKLHYYLLIFVDTFSGWIEAFPTSQETADMVASLLTQEIIPHFGLPATIQSDNGPAFTAQVVQLVAKSLNISWKLHIPCHPQSSGLGDLHPAVPLQPGDSVLLWELQQGSLQPRWSGPHVIILTTPMAAKLLGHTLWYHVSHLKVAPQNDQWKSESLGPTHLRLTRGPCPSTPNNPSSVPP
nr:uncharacterized protein LOC110569355 [Aotus nancymaae]